jgi:hypothetical protein
MLDVGRRPIHGNTFYRAVRITKVRLGSFRRRLLKKDQGIWGGPAQRWVHARDTHDYNGLGVPSTCGPTWTLNPARIPNAEEDVQISPTLLARQRSSVYSCS